MREFDVVIYGATGVAGRQAALYLDRYAGSTRWAIAGRSREKLEAIRKTLSDPRVGLIVADASAPESLTAMTRQTRAIATTVGPFRHYGTPLVEACIETGTHYADITGETPWVRSLIDRLDERARKASVRIVPFAGYDSVPSDLGALAIVEHVRKTRGVGVRRVEAFHSARGGYNGGSLATLIDLSSEGRRGFGDPWLLSPGFSPSPGARAFDADPASISRHGEIWAAPFVMSRINTRVVRRSVALYAGAGTPYGADFAYQEYWGSRRLAGALQITAGLLGLSMMMRRAPTRALVAKLGKQPGEGPSEESMERGSFTTRYVAEADDGAKVLARMKGEGDPGNKSTVRFLVETALALANDELPPRFGILTPAYAIGTRLLERCTPRGLSFAFD